MSEERGAEGGRRIHLDDIELAHHTRLPATRVSEALDAIVGGLGKACSWLWLAVIGIILWTVIARYLFGQGSVFREELAWYVSSAAWTMGLGYTLVVDAHVRVDVLHERMSLRTQAWIELIGIAVLLLPFLALGLWESVPYVWESYLVGEASSSPSGLAYRWFVKLFIPLCLALIGVAAVSRALKCTALLFGWPRPRPESERGAAAH